MKRLLGYLLGIGLGAAAGMAIARKTSRPKLGDKPRKSKPPSAPPTSKLGTTIRRALDEGRRVMKQTEAELNEQVAARADGLR